MPVLFIALLVAAYFFRGGHLTIPKEQLTTVTSTYISITQTKKKNF